MKSKFRYNPTLSGIENINRVLLNANIPEELLDNVEIVALSDPKHEKFAQYTTKEGNTALEVIYNGELRKSACKSNDVFFYDRVPPIPSVWKTQSMMIRDSELKDGELGAYVHRRFTADGYPFPGEKFTYTLEGKNSVLEYGHNQLKITASPRSYGLMGSAILNIQHLVDLNDVQVKVVSLINPFANKEMVVRKDSGYTELTVKLEKEHQDVKDRVVKHYLRETYGRGRADAILKELKEGNIRLTERDTATEWENPTDEELTLEKTIAEKYTASKVYTLEKDQEESTLSTVAGNFRMMVVKKDIGELLIDTGRYTLGENVAYRYRKQNSVQFVLSKTPTGLNIDIELRNKSTIDDAFRDASSMVVNYFSDVPATYLEMVKEDEDNDRIRASLLPSGVISEFVSGKVNINITFVPSERTQPPVVPSGSPTITLRRNLNGFSEVGKED